MRPRCLSQAFAVLLLLLASVAQSSAQSSTYPNQRITIMVGFAAGGSVDTVARFVAERLQAKWGHPVIVENRPGAAANVAAGNVARATPDGHTLLYTATSTAINQFLYAKPGYSIHDLKPISISTTSTTVIAVNAAKGPKTLKDLTAKHQKDGIAVGTSGVGSAGHITGEYFFKQLAKISAVMTPFNSGTASVTALAGGHVDAVSVAVSDAASLIKTGAVRALAVTGAKRAAPLPAIPTFEEAGFPGFTSYGWVALFAPAKTDPAILDKLNEAVNEALSDPVTKKKIEDAGFETNVQSLAWTNQFMAEDLAKWERMLKDRETLQR